jgi:hypothetical protein
MCLLVLMLGGCGKSGSSAGPGSGVAGSGGTGGSTGVGGGGGAGTTGASGHAGTSAGGGSGGAGGTSVAPDGGGTGGAPDGGGDATVGPDAVDNSGLALATTPVVAGKVYSLANGQPIAKAHVSASSGQSTDTDSDGWFVLADVPPSATGQSIALTADSPGFGEAIEVVNVLPDRDVAAQLVAVPAKVTGEVDATAGGTVSDPSGAAVTFPPGSLVTRAGGAVTGQVDVALAPLDLSSAAQLAASFGAPASNHMMMRKPLAGLAPMAITARQGLELLTIKGGMTAMATIPVPAALVARAAASVPLWSADPKTGDYVTEGTAASEALAAGPTVLHASVGHLSWWNGAQELPARCITGHITSADSATVPATWAPITLTAPQFTMVFRGISNGNGDYSMLVPAQASVTMSAVSWDGTQASDPVMFTTEAVDNPRAGLYEGCDPVATFGLLHKLPPARVTGAGNVFPLGMGPADGSGWTKSFGEASPPCTPPNPAETRFAINGSSAVLLATSTGLGCCGCTQRDRAWTFPAPLQIGNSILRGTFDAVRGAGAFGVGSFEIELKLNGTRLGNMTYAAENRPNNNCANHRPEKIVMPRTRFRIPLSDVAGGTFDEIRLHIMGYGCGANTAAAGLGQLVLETH